MSGQRVAIRCLRCRRLLRDADVEGDGITIVGGCTAEGAPMSGNAHRIRDGVRGRHYRNVTASCADATPGGPNPLAPTRYLFVCRGRHPDRRTTITASRLAEQCRAALRGGGPVEVLL